MSKFNYMGQIAHYLSQFILILVVFIASSIAIFFIVAPSWVTLVYMCVVVVLLVVRLLILLYYCSLLSRLKHGGIFVDAFDDYHKIEEYLNYKNASKITRYIVWDKIALNDAIEIYYVKNGNSKEYILPIGVKNER